MAKGPKGPGNNKNKNKNHCLTPLNNDDNFLLEMRADKVQQFVPRFIRELLQNRIDLGKYAQKLLVSCGVYNQFGQLIGYTDFGYNLISTLTSYEYVNSWELQVFTQYRDNLYNQIQQYKQQGYDVTGLLKQLEMANTEVNYRNINVTVYHDLLNGICNFLATGNLNELLPRISGNNNYGRYIQEPNLDPVQYVRRELNKERRKQQSQGTEQRRNNNYRRNARKQGES